MKSKLSSNPCACLFVLLFILVFAVSHARTQQSARPSKPARPAPQNRRDEASGLRAQAVNLLIDVADNARSFKDLAYRARIQLLAADALWSSDEARARQIFRRAWEAAYASDREDERAELESAGGGIFSNSDEATFTTARDEVLSKVAARDPLLAETFMRELLAERERASEAEKGNQTTRRTAWREPSPLGARRLMLAQELLNEKEYARAAALAEPLINEGVSGDLMEFLLRLRASDTSNQTNSYRPYLRLLEKTAASPNVDANDLLLLSSYIISPQLMMVVDEKGALQFRALSSTQVSNPQQSITAKPFYNLAVSVLLRSADTCRAANTVQDRTARFVATGRLLPFFEQAGPEYAQFVPAMRQQLLALSSEMEAARRDALSAQFELTNLNRKNLSDPLAPQLEELARTTDKVERDRISLGVVKRAARERLWDRAQRTAYSIEDGDTRRAALSFIVVNQIADISRAYRDDKEDNFEGVARFVRRADAPAFASAWGLTEAALIAARKGNRTEVKALLSEAESYAAREDKNTRRRIAAYIFLTNAAARTGDERVWDFFSELVRSVNSMNDYMGDETSLGTSNEASANEMLSEELSIESEAFRLDRIFATMARLDLDKTLTQAQSLTSETPRAFARLAAARAVLEKK